MSRALLFIVALGAALPAVAQTRVATLTAGDAIGGAMFSPHGERIAAAVGKDRVAVWSLPDGKLLQEMRLPQPLAGMIVVKGDQIVIALADGGIEVRNMATGAVVRRIDAGVRQSVLAVSADGRLLASSGRGQIRLWDASGTLLHTLAHEFGNVSSLAFSPDGTLLASAGQDTDVHLWNVATGQRQRSLRDQLLTTFSMTFTADGRNLVIGGANGTIEIVDVQTASVSRRFRPEKFAVSELGISADGRLVAASYFDVDGFARPAPLAVWDLASGRVVRRMMQGAPAAAVGFDSDGRLHYAMTKGPELSVWAQPDSRVPASGSAKPK